MPPPPHPPPPPPPPPPLTAYRLPLPPARPPAASLLLAPPSSPARAALALLFPDSSAHLFPSLPNPTASAPAPALPAPTTVPAPLAAAACFALLLPSAHLLFLSAHPSPASSAVHLRAYSLGGSARFAPAPLSFKRHASASGLPLQGLPFGLGVRLAGGVNAIALLSLAAGQIWVLGPRLAPDGRTVELHKCTVVELEPARPVYAMEVAAGRLLLGEAGGVRVFPLRALMKGGREREGRKEGAVAAGKKSLHRKNGIVNGMVVPARRGSHGGGGEGDAVSTCKLTTLRVKQSSGSYGSFLVTFKNDNKTLQGDMEFLRSVQAVSIHSLSKSKFLVLDSSGVLHVFSLPNTEVGSGTGNKQYSENIHIYRLDYPMKVQVSAVFPSGSAKAQIFWVSDGGHSVHIIAAFDVETPDSDNGGVGESELATIKLSAIEAIFTSEKVQDIVPISKDSVLILGQALDGVLAKDKYEDEKLMAFTAGSKSCEVTEVFEQVMPDYAWTLL